MPELTAIDLAGGPEFVDALRRAWDRGDAVLPVDQRLGAGARATLLGALRPARVVDANGEARLSNAMPVEPGDALVVATSGTTGVPKGVVLTHDAVVASALGDASDRLGVDPARHRWLACLPLNHVGGLSVVTRALLTGTPVDVLPGFEAAVVQERSGPEVLVSLVVTALARVSPERFRTVVLGGSTPPGDLAPNVVSTYGMTETGSGVVYDGVPLDGVEARISGGEIQLRGPMLLRAYRDGTVPLDRDGWLATGDGGRLDQGRLHVDGRLTDLIVTGGENVWPHPVEALLRTHPGVAEAAVAGRPDPEWGQRVVAYIVPVAGQAAPTLDELRGIVRDGLAAFAAPKELVVVTRLPKTPIGKVRRDLLTTHSPQNENRF